MMDQQRLTLLGLVSVLCLVIAWPTAAAEKQAQDQSNPTKRVYFIGNSLTFSTTLDRVHQLFAQRGVDLQFGSQLSGGKTLTQQANYRRLGITPRTWETNRKQGQTYEPQPDPWTTDDSRFGLYDEALVKHKWDDLVFQSYVSTPQKDAKAISKFIDLSQKNDSAKSYYFFSVWPNRMRSDKVGPDGKRRRKNIDFQAVWTRPYQPNKRDKVDASRAYTDKLYKRVRREHKDLEAPFRIIPAGDVLYVLDQKIKAGELPGIQALAQRKPDLLPGLDEDTDFSNGVNVFYADGVHFNPIPHQSDSLGIFVAGTTVYTVLSGENPVGLSGKPYGLDDEKDASLIKAIQRTIWHVVSKDPRTGVKARN